MGASEKIRALISLIKKLIKSDKPFKVILYKDKKSIVTYLYSIDVAGQKIKYNVGMAHDVIKQMLKGALKRLEKCNDINKLTVRLLIGKTEEGIDEQIDFLDESITNIQIAY